MKVKLGFFYDAWKVIADWIKGESSDIPKVEVTNISEPPDIQQVVGLVEIDNFPEEQKIAADDPIPVSINNSNMTPGSGIPTQSVSKIEIETILDAASIAPEASTGIIRATYKGESLTFYAINIDKQPFNAYTVSPFSTSSGYGPYSYPSGKGITKTFRNVGQPFLILQVATQEVDSWANALPLAISFGLNGVYMENKSTDTATVTIKVMRVWR